MRVRAAGRRPCRRGDRRPQLSPQRWPRDQACRNRADRADDKGSALAALIKDKDVSLQRSRRHARSLRPANRVRLSRGLGYFGAGAAAGARRRARLARCRRQGLRRRAAGRGGRSAGRKKGNLGHFERHKKRGKCSRYLGRDRAFYACRGPGFVGSASGDNDLPEFWPELDTGLCCDYFKAHDAGGRIFRPHAQVLGESADSCSRLGRSAPRAADRGGQGGTNRSLEREVIRRLRA